MTTKAQDASVTLQAPAGASLPPLSFKDKIKKRVSAWMIEWLAEHGQEILMSYVIEKAGEMAVAIYMAQLDREGLAHCYKCPQRFGLRKVGRGTYACLNHTREVQAANA